MPDEKKTRAPLHVEDAALILILLAAAAALVGGVLAVLAINLGEP